MMRGQRRTLWTVFLCILAITALCCTLAACQHTHKSDNEWHNDANGHWHECTECGEKLDEAQHDFEWVDKTPATCEAKGEQVQKCKTCGFEGETRDVEKAQHQLEPKHNDTKHWEECSVCHEKLNEEDHNWGSEWKEDASGHWHKCQGCDFVSDFDEHELEINADKTAFECKECGYSEEHTHNYTFVQDGPTGHHEFCEECGDVKATVAHRNADPNGKFVDDGNTHYFMCADCGRKVSATHNYGGYLDDGEGAHYRKCNDCDKEMEHIAHVSRTIGDSAGAAGHYATCETCDIQYVEEHDLSVAVDGENGHYNKCSECDYTSEIAQHDLSYIHLYTTISSSGSGGVVDCHYEICSGCSYQTDRVQCSLQSEYDEQYHWGYCTVCDTISTRYEKTEHNIVTKYDSEGHWHQCSSVNVSMGSSGSGVYQCGYVLDDKEQHDIDENVWAVNSASPNYHYNPCSKCATTSVNRSTHTQGSDCTPLDEEYHQFSCDKKDGGCPYVFQKSTHNFGDVQTDDADLTYYICGDCGYETEHKAASDGGHHPDTEWHTDGTWHWHICTDADCEELLDRAQHTFQLNDGWFEGEGCDICKLGVYEFDTATGTITMYTGNFDKLRIPSTIANVTVTALGKSSASSTQGAFYQGTFTKVEIPTTVTKINPYAFSKSAITEINVPDTVLSIGAGAFRECTALVKARVNAIDNSQIFYKCSALAEVICGSGVTSAANNVFYDCTALRKVVFESDTMPTISGKNTFKNVTDLTVYYKFSNDVYDESKIADSVLKGASIKFYYDERPSLKGGGVEDSDAWHYNSNGEIELWSESED